MIANSINRKVKARYDLISAKSALKSQPTKTTNRKVMLLQRAVPTRLRQISSRNKFIFQQDSAQGA